MIDDKPYIKNDLGEWATVENVEDEINRMTALRSVLPDSAIVHYQFQGSYSGELVLVIECGDYIWLHTDEYGSCSYCDPFLIDKENWTNKMLREAYCFETVADAREYVRNTENWTWSRHGIKNCASDLLDAVDSN